MAYACRPLFRGDRRCHPVTTLTVADGARTSAFFRSSVAAWPAYLDAALAISIAGVSPPAMADGARRRRAHVSSMGVWEALMVILCGPAAADAVACYHTGAGAAAANTDRAVAAAAAMARGLRVLGAGRSAEGAMVYTYMLPSAALLEGAWERAGLDWAAKGGFAICPARRVSYDLTSLPAARAMAAKGARLTDDETRVALASALGVGPAGQRL